MVVEPDGPLCTCGGRGHLEALISGPSIARQAREELPLHPRSSLRGLTGDVTARVSARLVTDAARGGDPFAVELLARAGRRLGHALVSLIHVFNPQVVALSGGVMNAGELLLAPARETVATGLMPVFTLDLRVEPASLGGDPGLYGAVALAQRSAGE
jgi:glucokinase